MKPLLGVALLFLGTITKSVSQEVIASVSQTDQLLAEGEHKATDNAAGLAALRGNAPLNTAPRLRQRQRPITSAARRLKASSLDKVSPPQHLSTRQERIQKYFRQAAQRRFASGIVIPRRREDTSKTAAVIPPSQRTVATTTPKKGGVRDAQEGGSAGVPRDTEKVAGRHDTKAPQLVITKFHGPIKAVDTSLSRRQGSRTNVAINEKSQESGAQGQIFSPKIEKHGDRNQEALVAQVTSKAVEASQGTTIDHGKMSHQHINQPTAVGGSLGIRERIRDQGIRARIHVREDESGEQARGIGHSFRRKRLRVRRPNIGRPRKASRLVARQNSPASIQEHRLSGSHQHPPPQLAQEGYTENQRTPIAVQHSSSDTAEGPISSRQQHAVKQAISSYLPGHPLRNDFSTSILQPQVDDDAYMVPSASQIPIEMQKDAEMGLGQHSLTDTLHNESAQLHDYQTTGVRQHHNTPKEQQPATESFPAKHSPIQLEAVNSPQKLMPIMDVLPHEMITMPSTSSQNPSHPPENIPSRSFDDFELSTFEHSPNLQEHLPKFDNLQRLSARQQGITNSRLIQHQQDRGQDLPQLRTFIIHRFSQNPQRTSQPQKLMPMRQPHAENFPITNTPQKVTSGFPGNDSRITQTPRDPQLQSLPPVGLKEATQHSEHLTQGAGSHALDFTPSQSNDKRLSDLSFHGQDRRVDDGPRIMPVSLRIHQRGGQVANTDQHNGQRMPLGNNRKDLQQTNTADERNLPITFDMHNQGENTQSFSTKEFLAIPQYLSPKTPEQPAEALHPTSRHNQQHHETFSGTDLDDSHYKTHLTHSQDVSHTDDIYETVLGTYTPTQATSHKTHHEDSSTQNVATDRDLLHNIEMRMNHDDYSFLEGVAVASLISGEHMGLKHTPPLSDTKVLLTDDDGAFSRNDGHLTSIGHTQTEEIHSESHQHTPDYSPSVIPSQNVPDAQENILNQELNLRQSSITDLLSSLEPHEATVYGSGKDHGHAEAYLLHLKKLESELERHVSLLREKHSRIRKTETSRKGSRGSSIHGEQLLNHRQNETTGRGSHASRITGGQVSYVRQTEVSEGGKHTPDMTGEQVSNDKQSETNGRGSHTSSITSEQVFNHRQTTRERGSHTSRITKEQVLGQSQGETNEPRSHAASITGEPVSNDKKSETRASERPIINVEKNSGNRQSDTSGREAQTHSVIREQVSDYRHDDENKGGSQSSSLLGEQISNYGQTGTNGRRDQTLRSNSGQKKNDFGESRNKASNRREFDQVTEDDNLRYQLRSQTNTRDEAHHHQSVRFTVADAVRGRTQVTVAPTRSESRAWRRQLTNAPRERTQEATKRKWTGSRAWRQQLRARADAGVIRLTQEERIPSPPKLNTIAEAAANPHLRQQYTNEVWHPHAAHRLPSPQERARVVQSSRDETKGFLSPRAPTTRFTSSPVRAAPSPGMVSSLQARQQSLNPDMTPTTLRAPLIFREGRQRQVLQPARRLINPHGQPTYTFQRIAPEGTSKENLLRHEGYFYSTSGQLDRSKESHRTASPLLEKANNVAFSRPGGEQLRTPSAGDSQNVRNVAQSRTAHQEIKQTHRGDKNAIWEHNEPSDKPAAERGSRKFLDTIRDRNEDASDRGLLKSLTAFLRGEDFSGHWITQDTSYQVSPQTQDFQIPQTDFRCKGRQAGYYADTHQSAKCSSFHFCSADGTHTSYMCPAGTAFSQRLQVCDHAFRVECKALRPAEHQPHHHHNHHHHLDNHHNHHHLDNHHNQHQRAANIASPVNQDRFGKRDHSQDVYHLRNRA